MKVTYSGGEVCVEGIEREWAGILSTCSKGVCGTCEIGVLEGVPEHRDTVLTRKEKPDGKSMMPCVSRCAGARLVLDYGNADF